MSHRLAVLFVGVGSIGHRHLRCFLSTGRVDAAICEPDDELRRRLAEEYNVQRTYRNLDEALSDRHDAAVISTPAPLHVPMAARLAEAGLHLLIEKPLSTSLAGIDALRQTVAARGVVAAVGYVYRAHPVLRAMREAIAAGEFGKPLQLIAVCGQHFPTYRPAYREIYYTDRATGGGAIQDAMTHVLNLGEWLLGDIERLTADAAHQALEGVAVEDTVHVLTRQQGALGCYSLNQHQAPNEMVVTVVCERGTVRYENQPCRWRWMRRPEEPWHDEPTVDLPRDALFIAQANAFLDAVATGARPYCTLDEGLQTLRVNLAALAAVDDGRWHDTSPQTSGDAS